MKMKIKLFFYYFTTSTLLLVECVRICGGWNMKKGNRITSLKKCENHLKNDDIGPPIIIAT